MGSHENPGELASLVPQPTPLLSHQASEPSFVTAVPGHLLLALQEQHIPILE